MLLIFSRRQIYFGKYFQRSQWFYKTQCNLIGEFVLVWPCRYLFQPGQYFRWGGVELTLLLGDLGQHVGVVGGGDVDSPSTTTTIISTTITTSTQQLQDNNNNINNNNKATATTSNVMCKKFFLYHTHDVIILKEFANPFSLFMFE